MISSGSQEDFGGAKQDDSQQINQDHYNLSNIHKNQPNRKVSGRILMLSLDDRAFSRQERENI